MKQIALIVSGALLLQWAMISSRADGEGDRVYSDELYTNTYQVPSDFFLGPPGGGRDDSFAAPAEGGGGTAVRKLLSAREILERAGVTFGERAFARGDLGRPRVPLLIVRNTQSQMELVEAYISGCNLGEKQVTVIVEYIEVDASWLSGWILDHRLDRDATPLREDVQKLVRKKKARVVDTSAVLARSGQRAKTESVSEYLYPASGDPPEISNSVKLEGKAEAPVTAFCQTSYNLKKLGISLEVDAVIGADDTTIDLNLAPRHTVLNGETQWPLPDSAAEFRRVQPKFSTDVVSTQVVVTDGHYELLGTVQPKESGLDGVKKTKLLVFVRADIGFESAGHEH